MYCVVPSLFIDSLLRQDMHMATSASRFRFSSTLLRLCTASFPPSVSRITDSSASSFARATALFGQQKQRTLSFSSALRSLTSYSAPRWSHGVNWRSPLSLRAQSRTATPGLKRLERKLSTLGIVLLLWIVHTIYV
jgi:aconitate hydratase